MAATNWKAQIGEGKFSVQFETSNFHLYRIVEKACQKAVEDARSGRYARCKTGSDK